MSDLARKLFTELRERPDRNPDAELDEFWAGLEPATIDGMEEFRGEVTATMVYDGQPTHDHFKQIDDNAVMGIMNGKGVLDGGRYFYFYLERV